MNSNCDPKSKGSEKNNNGRRILKIFPTLYMYKYKSVNAAIYGKNVIPAGLTATNCSELFKFAIVSFYMFLIHNFIVVKS